MKLPLEHITKAFELAVIRVSKFERHIRETLRTCFLDFSVFIDYTFIKYAADSLVGIIRFYGLRPAARQAFGNDWERIIRLTVYCDAATSLSIIGNVLDKKYFFEDLTKIYGSNYVMLAGSYRWMSIFCSSRTGITIPGTGVVTAYNFQLRDRNLIADGIKGLVGNQTYQEWVRRDFIISENYDRLIKLKQILPALGVYKPDFKTGLMERPCIGDLLVTDTKDKYYLLDSDGVSPLTFAYNLVFRTKLQTLNVASLDLTKHIFITWSGDADLFVRASQIEIWFDVPYNVVTSGPESRSTNYPQPEDQLSLRSNPETSDELINQPQQHEELEIVNISDSNEEQSQPSSSQSDIQISQEPSGNLQIVDNQTKTPLLVSALRAVRGGVYATVRTGAGVVKNILVPGAILYGANLISKSISTPKETSHTEIGGSLNLGPASVNLKHTVNKQQQTKQKNNNNGSKRVNNTQKNRNSK